MTTARVVLSAVAQTDRGLRREVNEDSVLASSPVFLVADGMGGHEAGDTASAAVVSAFAPLVGTDTTLADVGAALARANDAVTVISEAHKRGAGSTVAGAVLVEHEGAPHWLIFNVGDSRVYRHHANVLDQLTVDHSLGQELVDAGELRPEDLAGFARRNVITRAIGAADSVADSWLVPVIDGERLLICSDGLSTEVSDESIRATLTMCGRPESAAAALVHRAKEAGGRDNISVVVIDVVSGGAAPVGQDSTDSMREQTTGSEMMREGTTFPVGGARS